MPTLILLRHGQSQWNLEDRFTGWVDVDLTPEGEAQARKGGELIKAAGLQIDRAYTSVQTRAIRTLWLALAAAGQAFVPETKDWRLNERHYGGLTGLNKTETAAKHGDEQVKVWRRSYDVPPPGGESLKDTAARTLPYYEDVILPFVKEGETVLVAAHGNSLRSMVMAIEGLTPDEILKRELATGAPIVYRLDAEGEVVSHEDLAG